jgi:hypothetical protein
MMRSRDKELDLLTAALIGLAVGATATLLLRRGPSGHRPLATGLSAAGRGALWAGAAGVSGAKTASRAAAEGTRRGVARGMEMLDELPLDDIGDQLSHYIDAAKGAIEDTVRGELRDLRKSIRRQRKRLGI